MINVERKEDIAQDTVQTMEPSSQIFHLKTSLICSLEEVTHQVSNTFSVCVTCDHVYMKCQMCCIYPGNAHVHTNGRMRYQRRERRERQRDVSLIQCGFPC